MNLDEILALPPLPSAIARGASELLYDGMQMQMQQYAIKYANAAIQHYKDSVLKEVGEPVVCIHHWHDFGSLGGKNVSRCGKCDALAFTGNEPDTSDQVAAAIIKATKPLESVAKPAGYFQVEFYGGNPMHQQVGSQYQAEPGVFPLYTAEAVTVAVNQFREQLTKSERRIAELEEQYELAANLANTSMDRVRELELIVALKDDAIAERTVKVRELEEEKRLLEDDCGYQMQWKREFREQLEYSQKQLASAQLQIKQLRDALTKIEYLESDNGCILSAGDCSSLATEALSTPISTEALDAYVAEKVKEAVK